LAFFSNAPRPVAPRSAGFCPKNRAGDWKRAPCFFKCFAPRLLGFCGPGLAPAIPASAIKRQNRKTYRRAIAGLFCNDGTTVSAPPKCLQKGDLHESPPLQFRTAESLLAGWHEPRCLERTF